jgi:hypothetical protein
MCRRTRLSASLEATRPESLRCPSQTGPVKHAIGRAESLALLQLGNVNGGGACG